jgi:D-glycero-alpha-D-manno-heptose 1-phosphate guanylyltransferase
MAPVYGRPFIEWVVRFYAGYGLNQFVLSTGYLSEVIERHFAAQPVPHVEVKCCVETTPLGTAGGALNCVPMSAEPASQWLVVNGDSLVFASPLPLLHALRATDVDAGLLGLQLPDTARYGTLEISAQNRLQAFREKRPGAGTINAGVYAFQGAVLLAQPPQRPLSFETDVFPKLAATGRVAVVSTEAPFLDIGTPESLAQAERFIAENQTRFLS